MQACYLTVGLNKLSQPGGLVIVTVIDSTLHDSWQSSPVHTYLKKIHFRIFVYAQNMNFRRSKMAIVMGRLGET